MTLRFFAKVWSIVGSCGYRREVNELQWLRPMVWAPESATVSVASKFFVARRRRTSVVLANGGGRLSSVACLVAKLRPSRLPSGTL